MPSANPRFELLNTLLFHPDTHREQIIIILGELAAVKAGNLHFAGLEDRQDAIGEAILLAMEKLHCYDAKRHAACTYFGRLMTRHMLKFIQRQRSMNCLHDQPVQRTGSNRSILDAGTTPWGARRVEARDYRLRHAEDRRRAMGAIDRALRGAMDERERGDEDTHDRAQLAISILQMIRKQLLGRFNRMMADQLRIQADS